MGLLRFCNILKSLADPNSIRTIFFLVKVAFAEFIETFRYSPLFRRRSAAQSELSINRPIRIGVLIDEYFGGWETQYGGYGFLARRLVARYLPSEDIQVEVIIHGRRVEGLVQERGIDGVKVYKLSVSDRLSRYWLLLKRYDAFLSIELTSLAAIRLAPKTTPHILWIQDPRPQSEWDEIATVTLFPEPNYYDQQIYDYVAKKQDRIRFVTQGLFLNDLARELYSLKKSILIEYLPNPIEIPLDRRRSDVPKENLIVFLGRIDSVKRGWIFCEIAKRLPEYQFHVLGAIHNNLERNKAVLSPYIDETGRSKIKNLHFEGHVDGERKQAFLQRAKILVNSSIHEALPVSFLEALATRTLLVSCRNPEGLTERFGFYTGPVLGDGFDRVNDFIEGIREIIGNEKRRRLIAACGYRYVRTNHSIEKFQCAMRKVVIDEVNKHRLSTVRASVIAVE
jgi:glycosyltransferase involved in cell wall biosynthesis